MEKVAAAKEGDVLELPNVDNVLLDLPGEQVGERPVAGAWQVAFPNGFKPNVLAKGAEERVVFDAPVDWTKRSEEGIRHFSGTAAYTRTIDLGGLVVPEGGKVMLDLGEVRDFAEVTVNGRTFPVLWKPPFRVDVTEAARSGESLKVAVRVTNLWPNRLIRDAGLPERERLTRTNLNPYKPGDALLPSGLFGPVTLAFE